MRSPFVRSALAMALCAAAPLCAQQNEPDLSRLSLDELLDVKVTSASRIGEAADVAPSTVYVITSDEITRLGLRDLKDILALVPGVETIDPHFFLLGGQRGFVGSFASTLLLINGREMNNLIAGETFISNQFRAGNIRQVEVMNGPGSALYGANALAGVINIITKTATPFDGVELTTAAGSFRTGEANVVAGGSTGALSVRTSISLYHSRGDDFSSFLSNTAIASPAAENNAYRRLPDVYGYDNTSHALSGSLNGDYRALSFGAEMYRNITGRGTSGIQWDYTRGSDQRDLVLGWIGLHRDFGALHLTTEYRRYHEAFRGNHTEDEGPIVNPVTGAIVTSGATGSDVETYRGFYSNFAGGGSHRNVLLAQATFSASPRHTVIAGVTGETSHIVAASFARDEGRDPPLTPDDTRPEFSNWKRGVYVQDQSHFLRDTLIVTAGVRRDEHQRYGVSVDPRAGVVWRARPATTLKLMYGEAFREPDVFEIQNSAGRIRPTSLRTFEAAWNQFFGEHVKNELVAFHNHADDLIVTDVIAIGGISNKGRLRSHGIEDLLRYRVGAWTGFANLTLTTAELNDAHVHDIPRVEANAGITYEIGGEYAASVVARHHGSVDTEYHAALYDVAPYTVFDATLTWLRVPWRGDLQLIARNLLNRTYYQPEPRAPSVVEHPQDGRDVSLRVTVRF